MKRIFLFLLLAGHFSFIAFAQSVGLKTNALYLGTASPNLGVEFSIGKKFSMSIEGSYNPFAFKPDMFWKHWFVQPELRWWYCHRYAGSFWGVHPFFAEYNISVPDITKFRYEGNLYGAGISYGYSWILNNKWNLEASLGAGYALMNYDKYECGECGEKLGEFKRNYIGPTKAAISLIYYFR